MSRRLGRFAYVAAKLNGAPNRGDKGLEAFVDEQLGFRLPFTTANAMIARARAQSPLKRPTVRPGETAPRKDAPAVRGWLQVDEPALGLLKALIHVANDGERRENLASAVAALPGIRQVIETKVKRELFAVAIFRTDEEGDSLLAEIEGLIPDRDVHMDRVRMETHEPALLTWLAITARERDSPMPD